MSIIVPNVYLKFLSDNQQRIFDDGVLYDYEEILERYETLEFAEYAKELIPIGNDNGDYELVMKASEEETRFAVIDQGALGSVKPKSWKNFTKWYSKGPKFDFLSCVSKDNPIVSIYIKALPEDNRVKVLLQIKKAFVLEMSTSELLKLASNLPCIISNKYYRAQAEGRIKDNNLQDWVAYK